MSKPSLSTPRRDGEQPCPFIAESVVKRSIGEVPNDIHVAASYALYCCSSLCVLRRLLEDREIVRSRKGKAAYDDSIRTMLEHLTATLAVGKPIVRSMEHDFSDARTNVLDFDGTTAITAHFAALDLATKAVVVLERRDIKRYGEMGLSQQRSERLRREIVCEARALAKTRKKGRKRRKPAPKKLTPIQAKTLEVVAECKGNIAKAAKRLGKDRKTVKQAYERALAKIGKETVTYGKDQKRAFLRDRRGQDDVSEIDDQRRDSDEDQQRKFRKR